MFTELTITGSIYHDMPEQFSEPQYICDGIMDTVDSQKNGEN